MARIDDLNVTIGGSTRIQGGRTLLVRLQYLLYIFFFQAEDGIRDLTVTGVQTCALPICQQLVGLDPHGAPQTIPLSRVEAVWHRRPLVWRSAALWIGGGLAGALLGSIEGEIGRAHVWTPVTVKYPIPSSAWKKKQDSTLR